MSPPLIIRARSLLGRGKVVGVPTDTVYGLATHHSSQEELFRLKVRPEGKPIPVLVASIADAERIACFPPLARRLARDHWPGPLTLVLSLRPEHSDPETTTVGLRMPDHPLALELVKLSGPLSVTSANRSGDPPATSHLEAREMFGDQVEVYLPGVSPGGVASTVLEVLPDRPPKVLRAGPVSLENSR